MKDNFFDRAAVKNAVDRATRRTLSRAGSFVRRTARRSIKPAGKRAKRKREKLGRGYPDPTISKPGDPPRLHTNANQNLRLIFFAWEPTRKTVVVGPVAFKSINGISVPEVLEKGGRSYLVGRRGRKKPIRVQARPFMGPALAKEAPQFPNLFANSVKP